MDLHAALADNFGHAEFRPYQEEIIRSVMDGRDTLGVLPTGAGKSLCYQLPALLLPRPTLVISPLIALMKDQLDGLPPDVYPRATLINSSVDGEELQRRFEAIAEGKIKLIYAAPERLRQRGFLRLLATVGLSLVVVDEAHCVGVWGHDFRPDYLFIRKALEALAQARPDDSYDPESFFEDAAFYSDPTSEAFEPALPRTKAADTEPDSLDALRQVRPAAPDAAPVLLALTATATPEMQGEIAVQLGRPLHAINGPMFRPNLRLEVFPCANADAKMKRLVALCRETSGSAIVYANSRDRCEQLAQFLNRQRLPAAFYHAGLNREERRETQERFMLGQTRIIVATVAFGMGVDKPNVRLVVHYSLPQSLESYTQEAGRAGRDGKPSRCALLYAPADKANLSRWLRQEEVKLDSVKQVYRALQSELGKGSGPVAPEMLLYAVGGNEEDARGADTRLRVAISLLEKCGLVNRHPDSGRAMQIEMLRPPPDARAELERLLEARRTHGAARLAEMIGFAAGRTCRHAVIALHFGQKLEACGSACDCCLGTAAETVTSTRLDPPTADRVPDFGRAILEAVHTLPFSLGRTGLGKLLTGAIDSPVTRDRSRAFGVLAGLTLKTCRTYMDDLLQRGLLEIQETDEYSTLCLTAAGEQALSETAVIIANPYRDTPVRKAGSPPHRTVEITGTVPIEPPGEDADDRFERLRAWRRITAERDSVPPFVVFHDATLRAIALANPQSLEAMQTIAGIGPRKLERYGTEIIDLLHGPGENLEITGG